MTDLASGITPTTGVAPAQFSNPGNATDGNTATSATRAGATPPFATYLQVDLGAAHYIARMELLEAANTGFIYYPYYSTNGTTWVRTSGDVRTYLGSNRSRYDFTAVVARYWRLYDGPFSSGGAHPGITWKEWTVENAAPVAAFSAAPRSGVGPLTVQFSDESLGGVTAWSWDFGDGDTSTDQNPEHEYADPGEYTVVLTVTSTDGSDTETKVEYIVVSLADPLSGVFIDWDGDGFGAGSDDEVSGDPQNVVSWLITRGASAEIVGGAQPGSATLTLKNPNDIYNPRNTESPLYGKVTDGRPVWIGVGADGSLAGADPRGLFGGRVTDVTLLPAPGASVSPLVQFACEDMLSWAQRVPVQLDYEEGRSHKALRQAALDAAGETGYDLDNEIHTMPLSHADGSLGSILEAINSVNGTRHFAKPSNHYLTGYRYTTYNRHRHLDGSFAAALSAEDNHVTSTDGWRQSADTVINRQKATVTPIQFTPGTFTVWEAEQLPITVDEDHPYSRIVEFDDVTSGATLDIAYTGDTVTSTLEPFASGAKITLTVGAGDEATVTRLSIEGRLARRLPAESVTADDEASQAPPRGVREGGEIGNEYIGVLASARGIVQHVVFRYGNPQLRPTLTVESGRPDDDASSWLPNQFDLDLYEVISFSSPQLAMSGVLFEIVGLTHEGRLASAGPVHHITTYVLQESRVQRPGDFPWFILDDPSSLLDDGVHVLAY